MKPILDKGKLALGLAAIFGSFLYYSAMKMGAFEMPNLFFSLVGFAFVWGIYMYCFQQFMSFIKKKLENRFLNFLNRLFLTNNHFDWTFVEL